MAFVGDTKFPGDGGANLQRLWEKWPWRPLVDQPGKYTMRRIGDGVPPEALCETAGLGKLKAEKIKGASEHLVLVELDGGGGELFLLSNARNRIVD
jgi:hypothetical protein